MTIEESLAPPPTADPDWKALPVAPCLNDWADLAMSGGVLMPSNLAAVTFSTLSTARSAPVVRPGSASSGVEAY